MSNRRPSSEHTSRRWRIHEIIPDFTIEDVWVFRTPGAGPHDFPLMLRALRSDGGLHNQSRAPRMLFAIRWKLGALLGWDKPDAGLNVRVRSLIERLPADLCQPVTGTPVPNTPFTTLYELADEGAYELANKTVHDVLHLGWVEGSNGDHELQMAALVKPNGLFGRLYLTAINPLRYLVVYPALTRQWERAWLKHRGAGVRPTAAPEPRRQDLDECGDVA